MSNYWQRIATTVHKVIGTVVAPFKIQTHAGAGFDSDGQEEIDRFFFHSDHLGSTSYLTDHDGNVSQFVCYTPYGETLVDEHLTGVDSTLHNGTYRTRYLFNGKELDSETGLYYYGARYYEPKHTFWYGVDPLTEKYPFNSAFVYCNGNPVKYVDPDGRFVTVFKASASAGVGIGYGLSGKIESGLVLDNYGITTYTSFTGNHFNNQHLEDESQSPQVYAGGYIGANVGFEMNWTFDSYSEYAESVSHTAPVKYTSLTIGDGGFGISLGIGVGITFESSPSSCTYSLSMTAKEFGESKCARASVSNGKCETLPFFISDIQKGTSGYSGVATILDTNGNIVKRFDVTCGVDKKGNPNQQWETTNYTKNKGNDN